MLRLRLISALCALGATLALASGASSANQPGDPCTNNGELADLAGGKIQCVNGTWAPYAGSSAGTASGTPTTPATGGTVSGTTSIKAAAIFKKVGVALSQTTFASTGKQVADATAVQLPNGRVRIYAFVSGTGVQSATSTDATGTKFVADAGTRITWAPGGQTRVYRLADGRYRLFYVDAGAIQSAISRDGLKFTNEGVRISTADAGFEPGVMSVVKTATGYRGYFSNLEKPGVMADRITKTATSPDMLNWTVGPTITGTSGTITAGASHPFAITDGKTIALYYNGDRSSWYGALRSTSTDGIHFKNERTILQMAGDPQVLTLKSGTTLLYYGGEVDKARGQGTWVATTSSNPITGG